MEWWQLFLTAVPFGIVALTTTSTFSYYAGRYDERRAWNKRLKDEGWLP